MENISKLLFRIKERKEKNRKSYIDNEVNNRITIRNDRNDSGNSIFLFVDDVPIMEVCADNKNDACIDISNVYRYMARVKDMYRRVLNGEKIRF